jgi:transposase
MLIVHPNTKIYLYDKATDTRKAFNALAIIRQKLHNWIKSILGYIKFSLNLFFR